MIKYEGAPCRPTEIIQLLISCSIIYACICIEISWLAYWWQTCHVFFFLFIYLCLTPSSLTLRGETWNKEHFLLIFIVPICSQKCILDSPLHIYKDIPEGRAVSDSFWSITSNIPHMRFLPLEGKKKKKNFWEIVYCNLETELCKHWVKSSLFPVTLSLMKVAKSPGGLKSTVCLCLREHSRGTRGEARW